MVVDNDAATTKENPADQPGYKKWRSSRHVYIYLYAVMPQI